MAFFVRGGQIALSGGLLKILIFVLGVKKQHFLSEGVSRKGIRGE